MATNFLSQVAQGVQQSSSPLSMLVQGRQQNLANQIAAAKTQTDLALSNMRMQQAQQEVMQNEMTKMVTDQIMRDPANKDLQLNDKLNMIGDKLSGMGYNDAAAPVYQSAKHVGQQIHFKQERQKELVERQRERNKEAARVWYQLPEEEKTTSKLNSIRDEYKIPTMTTPKVMDTWSRDTLLAANEKLQGLSDEEMEGGIDITELNKRLENTNKLMRFFDAETARKWPEVAKTEDGALLVGPSYDGMRFTIQTAIKQAATVNPQVDPQQIYNTIADQFVHVKKGDLSGLLTGDLETDEFVPRQFYDPREAGGMEGADIGQRWKDLILERKVKIDVDPETGQLIISYAGG